MVSMRTIWKSRLKRRLKYYAIWTPPWIIVVRFLLDFNFAALFAFQVLFLFKDILDVVSKRDVAPTYFEHLPFSLSTLVLAGSSNGLLLLLSLLDSLLDAYEDIFLEK